MTLRDQRSGLHRTAHPPGMETCLVLLVLLTWFFDVGLGGPFNLLGPEIAAPELHRITPSSVQVETSATADPLRPVITLVGRRFTEEYGNGALRCRFNLAEGPVTVCAKRITAGCVATAEDPATR